MFAAMNYDANESFNPMVVAGVPHKPEHFKKVFDEDGVQGFVMFEIVNDKEQSLFEFTSLGKGYAYSDKQAEVNPMTQSGSPERMAKVEQMALFYDVQEAHGTELSFFDAPWE